MDVPASLHRWFVIHFAVDLAFAVPLLLVPAYTMRLLGWTTVEPVATRLVGAALAAIGLQSLLGECQGAFARRQEFGYLKIALGIWLVISAYLWPHSTAQLANVWISGLIVARCAAVALATPGIRFFNTAVGI